jgi:hypothetical protein
MGHALLFYGDVLTLVGDRVMEPMTIRGPRGSGGGRGRAFFRKGFTVISVSVSSRIARIAATSVGLLSTTAIYAVSQQRSSVAHVSGGPTILWARYFHILLALIDSRGGPLPFE